MSFEESAPTKNPTDEVTLSSLKEVAASLLKKLITNPGLTPFNRSALVGSPFINDIIRRMDLTKVHSNRDE